MTTVERRPLVSRSENVDGRIIHVIDGLFGPDEIGRLHRSLLLADFTCLHASRESTRKYREWMADFSVSDFTAHWVFPTLEQIVHSLYPESRRYSCYSAFCNAFSYGDITFCHHDAEQDDHISLLYYVNSEWDKDWGGETVFFDSAGDARACIGVVPGRLIAFPGDVVHRAGVPTRACHEIRLTLSVRFTPGESSPGSCE